VQEQIRPLRDVADVRVAGDGPERRIVARLAAVHGRVSAQRRPRRVGRAALRVAGGLDQLVAVGQVHREELLGKAPARTGVRRARATGGARRTEIVAGQCSAGATRSTRTETRSVTVVRTRASAEGRYVWSWRLRPRAGPAKVRARKPGG